MLRCFYNLPILISLVLFSFSIPLVSYGPEYWNNEAQTDLRNMLAKKLNTNVAKNVILFLGDGMGISTVTAGRIYKGQLMKQTGEEVKLTFEDFPEVGLVKTYNTDQQVPDSAGTGTAFLCGVKAKAGTVGLNDHAQYNNCSSQAGTEVTSIFDWSKAEGKSSGIVTNTRITHATPAAAYAHSSSRSWEGDHDLWENYVPPECTDIAYQLIMNNSDINVLFGGGRRYFLHINKTDPEMTSPHSYQRRDLDLIDEWERKMEEQGNRYRYVWNNEGFAEIDPDNVDNVLGLFQSSHMDYEYARDHGPYGEPSLAEMTKKAIQILQKNEKGYFLMVEGGRIDHAHHGTRAARALLETVTFDDAILEAVRMTNESDTLLVVTADHSHVFMMGGYPSRGNDILGVVDDDLAEDNMTYTTLVYGNGEQQRRNLSGIDTTSFNFRQTSAVPMSSETHGGEDIPVYARGPMAHLFVGTHEQSYIAHAMAYASCVGMNKEHCNNPVRTTVCDQPSEAGKLNTCYINSLMAIVLILVKLLSFY